MDAGLSDAAAGLVSSDGTATVVSLATPVSGGVFTTAQYEMLLAFRQRVDALSASSGTALRVSLTGAFVVSTDSDAAINADIASSDSVSIAVSFMVLGVALRSARLVLLSAACLAAALGFTFLLTWPLCRAMAVPSFTTSLLIATLVSLSLDYSLFLLTRVRASFARGVAAEAAVEDALRVAGHTVAVSGGVLAACFLVLAIFPVSLVRGPGIATAFAVAGSVFANLTLTPALLLSFPGFFAGGPLSCCRRRRRDAAGAADAEQGAAFGADDVTAPPASPPGKLAELVRAAAVWRRVARFSRRFQRALLLLMLAVLLAPFAFQLNHLTPSESALGVVPRGSPSVAAFYEVAALFGPATAGGATLLGVAPHAAAANATPAALQPAFFASAAAAVRAVLAASAGELAADDVSGLAWSSGAPTNAADVAAGMAAAASCPATNASACTAACSAQHCMLRLYAASTLSADGAAMTLALSPNVFRQSDAGVAWGNRVRSALAAANTADASGVTWFFVVDPASDSIRYVYERLGTLVGVTAAVIFAILLVAFRSPVAAARSLVSLCVMGVAVWGGAIGVYGRDVLPRSDSAFDGQSGLFWLVPLIAFSLTTGLCLDYDILLLDAVAERLAAGDSPSDAVDDALVATGGTISFAGAILTAAFSGFLAGKVPLLNQLGYFIVGAVLLFVFLIRPLLTAPLLHVLGRWASWPLAVPQPQQHAASELQAADGCEPRRRQDIQDYE